jgi:murein DD-endopeptidase MepM/ murein hydrolase activator NlpD
MRWMFAATLLALPFLSASAEPVCAPSKAVFGSLPLGKCAPVNGAIPIRQQKAGCAGGFFGDPRSGLREHDGIDFLADVGDPVHSAMNGIMLWSAYFKGTSGYQVAIRHADGQVSRYFHLKDETGFPIEGETVSAGDVIGYAGKTGNAKMTTCPHLHLDLRTADYPPSQDNPQWTFGEVVDPSSWIISTGDATSASASQAR